RIVEAFDRPGWPPEDAVEQRADLVLRRRSDVVAGPTFLEHFGTIAAHCPRPPSRSQAGPRPARRRRRTCPLGRPLLGGAWLDPVQSFGDRREGRRAAAS